MKLKYILQYFGLLALSITTLLGCFYLLGEVLLSFFGVAILIFVLYYLVNLLVNKREETHQDFFNIILLFVIYILIAGFSSYFSIHFLTVEIGASEKLRINGNEKLETIIKIRTEFKNSVDELGRDLSMEVNGALQAYFNAPRNSIAKESKKWDLENTYKFPQKTLNDLSNRNIKQTTAYWIESNIKNSLEINVLKEKNQIIFDESKKIMKYYTDNKDVFNNNQYLKTSKIYYQLDTILPIYKRLLENKFQEISNKFNVPNLPLETIIIPKSELKLNNFRNMWANYGNFIFVVIIIIIHLLILLPFILATKKGLRPLSEEDTATEL